jgi:hypothetical protein
MTRFGTRAAATAALLTALAAPATAQIAPTPTFVGLPEDVLALVCAPTSRYDMPDQSLRVTGGQDTGKRRSYFPGDFITISGGRENGIEPGQEYYVRRLQMLANQKPSHATPANIRTTGWIKVYAVDDQLSLATVVHACDSIDVHDYLEPFVMPVVPKVSTEKAKPQRDNYGRILFAADYRLTLGKGDYFMVNRGSDHGVAPGDRFVIYRDKKMAENFLYDLGEAVAIDVKADSATLQAIVSRDAFMPGDYVAPRKPFTSNAEAAAPKRKRSFWKLGLGGQ